jgi:hypothetical protein
MLLLGYVLAIRLERLLCREVQVSLAYRWFCGLSIEDKLPDHCACSRARHERFRESGILRRMFEATCYTKAAEQKKLAAAALGCLTQGMAGWGSGLKIQVHQWLESLGGGAEGTPRSPMIQILSGPKPHRTSRYFA